MGLTRKRRRFIEEYLKDFNATQAAKRAGYSERTAYSQGSRLLKIVEISDAIDSALMSGREIRARIDKIAKIGETDATKLRALELAAKTVGLFKEDNARDVTFRLVREHDEHGIQDQPASASSDAGAGESQQGEA